MTLFVEHMIILGVFIGLMTYLWLKMYYQDED